MKITTEAMRAGLKAVAPAVAVNPDQPQLAGVTVHASPDGLSLSATNHQVWIDTRLDIEADLVGEEWQVVASHRLLTQILGVARGKGVELTIEGRTLRVGSGRSFWLAPIMAAEPMTWPAMPAVWAKMDARSFADTVQMIGIAADPDPAKTPALDVIELHGGMAGLDLVATNRYRIHSTHVGTPTEYNGRIYPEADLLIRTAASMSGEVTLHAAEGASTFALSDERTTVVMATKSIDKWLSTEAMLTSWRSKITASTIVQAAELLAAIRGAAVGAQDGQPITITASDDEVIVAGYDTDSGAAGSVPLDEAEHDGPGLVVVVNPDNIIPTLVSFGESELVISWTTPKSAALLTVPETSATFAIMPLSVEGARWLDEPVAAEPVGAVR